MPTTGSHTSLWGGSCWLQDGGLLVRIYHSMICIMHDSLPSWHRLVEEWMGCSYHTTMLIFSPILSSTGRWTLAWSTIASNSIHYINSKRGSAIPCCNNWRAILFAHWYKLVQQFFSKKNFWRHFLSLWALRTVPNFLPRWSYFSQRIPLITFHFLHKKSH